MQSEEKGLETKKIKGDKQKIEGKGKDNDRRDFGNDPQMFVMKDFNRSFGEFMTPFDNEKARIRTEGKNFYELTLKNNGGLVMPIIIQWTYTDGTTETQKIPAEIWRFDENEVKKVFIKEKQVAKISIDPEKLTADTNTDNNTFPREVSKSRFDSFIEEK